MNDKVYISGPMSGHTPEDCRRRFSTAERALRAQGYTRIVNPVRVWPARWPWLYRLMERVFGPYAAYAIILFYDLALLLRCTRIYKMPGWRGSRGCQIESCVAFHFGIFTLAKHVREKVDKALNE